MPTSNSQFLCNFPCFVLFRLNRGAAGSTQLWIRAFTPILPSVAFREGKKSMGISVLIRTAGWIMGISRGIFCLRFGSRMLAGKRRPVRSRRDAVRSGSTEVAKISEWAKMRFFYFLLF